MTKNAKQKVTNLFQNVKVECQQKHLNIFSSSKPSAMISVNPKECSESPLNVIKPYNFINFIILHFTLHSIILKKLNLQRECSEGFTAYVKPHGNLTTPKSLIFHTNRS